MTRHFSYVIIYHIEGDRPLSHSEARKKIRELSTSGRVRIHPHAKRRMGERQVTYDDVMRVLKAGAVVDHSRPDPNKGWRYLIQGADIDGRRIKCSVEINGNVLVVTVMK